MLPLAFTVEYVNPVVEPAEAVFATTVMPQYD
jgi:hypothetical protein